jgi:hypothetical protein
MDKELRGRNSRRRANITPTIVILSRADGEGPHTEAIDTF